MKVWLRPQRKVFDIHILRLEVSNQQDAMSHNITLYRNLVCFVSLTESSGADLTVPGSARKISRHVSIKTCKNHVRIMTDQKV